jgi:CubicO group peptidase (beta-lactamase class C family)
VDEGKVSLDDRVSKFIPQLDKWMAMEEKDRSQLLLKPPVHPVTIRHLLSHTSGLTGSSELQRVTGADSTSLKARALSSVTGPLQWQPGDKYAYGNQGMNVAARIVEIVSGTPYEEFLQKRFFDPLGMKDTNFYLTPEQLKRLAKSYKRNDAGELEEAEIYMLSGVDLTSNKLLGINVATYLSFGLAHRLVTAELGLTQRDVANNVLVSLSSSAVVSPNYWSDPRTGINYVVAVQTPQSRVDSVNTLMNTSVTAATPGPPQLLSNLATLERRKGVLEAAKTDIAQAERPAPHQRSDDHKPREP